jgi:hypothetical protein
MFRRVSIAEGRARSVRRRGASKPACAKPPARSSAAHRCRYELPQPQARAPASAFQIQGRDRAGRLQELRRPEPDRTRSAPASPSSLRPWRSGAFRAGGSTVAGSRPRCHWSGLKAVPARKTGRGKWRSRAASNPMLAELECRPSHRDKKMTIAFSDLCDWACSLIPIPLLPASPSCFIIEVLFGFAPSAKVKEDPGARSAQPRIAH